MSGNYFDRLEGELRAAVPRSNSRGRVSWRGRGLRRSFGGLAVALSVAVTLGVVFLVVGVHGQRPGSGHRPILRHRGVAPGEFIYPLGAVPTLQQLRENFAVLRRPQTAADRSWRPACDCGQAARQLTGLTRLAATLPGGYRIFLDVEQFILGGQLNMAAGSYVLNLDIVNRKGNSSGAAFGPNVGYTIFTVPSGGPGSFRGHMHGSQVFASIVPDGVATVSWTFGCPRFRASARACVGLGTRTFTVPVANNVAARQLPGGGNCPPCGPGQVVWRASDGRVVASFPQGFGNLPAPPFVAGGLGSRVLRVLQPDSVATARIGEPSETAIQAITQVLGPPADANAPTGGCGIDHESVWTSPAVADPLTMFEKAGRFVGYQYGAPVNQIGLQRGPGAVLATPRGLTLDDTIGAARRLYPTGFGTSASRGVGRWRATGDGGTLYGFVLPTIYPLRAVTDKNPVATVDGGDTGCPPHGQQ